MLWKLMHCHMQSSSSDDEDWLAAPVAVPGCIPEAADEPEPEDWLNLDGHVALIMMSSPLRWASHMQTEYYAGEHEVTKAAWRRGRTAVPFEIKIGGDSMDMLHPLGYVHATHQALRTLENAILAPVCSSWVPVNLGTSKRTKAHPLGDTSLQYVRSANTMVSRTLQLLWMFSCFGVCWLLEQPCGSLMQHHPAFQRLLKKFKVFRIYIEMGWYSGSSKKGTWIYSNYEFVKERAVNTTHTCIKLTTHSNILYFESVTNIFLACTLTFWFSSGPVVVQDNKAASIQRGGDDVQVRGRRW